MKAQNKHKKKKAVRTELNFQVTVRELA